MKITKSKIEISQKEAIPWDKIGFLRLVNRDLALILNDKKIIELKGLTRDEIDQAFKLYSSYMMTHPKKLAPHSSGEEAI